MKLSSIPPELSAQYLGGEKELLARLITSVKVVDPSSILQQSRPLSRKESKQIVDTSQMLKQFRWQAALPTVVRDVNLDLKNDKRNILRYRSASASAATIAAANRGFSPLNIQLQANHHIKPIRKTQPVGGVAPFHSEREAGTTTPIENGSVISKYKINPINQSHNNNNNKAQQQQPAIAFENHRLDYCSLSSPPPKSNNSQSSSILGRSNQTGVNNSRNLISQQLSNQINSNGYQTQQVSGSSSARQSTAVVEKRLLTIKYLGIHEDQIGIISKQIPIESSSTQSKLKSNRKSSRSRRLATESPETERTRASSVQSNKNIIVSARKLSPRPLSTGQPGSRMNQQLNLKLDTPSDSSSLRVDGINLDGDIAAAAEIRKKNYSPIERFLVSTQGGIRHSSSQEKVRQTTRSENNNKIQSGEIDKRETVSNPSTRVNTTMTTSMAADFQVEKQLSETVVSAAVAAAAADGWEGQKYSDDFYSQMEKISDASVKKYYKQASGGRRKVYSAVVSPARQQSLLKSQTPLKQQQQQNNQSSFQFSPQKSPQIPKRQMTSESLRSSMNQLNNSSDMMVFQMKRCNTTESETDVRSIMFPSDSPQHAFATRIQLPLEAKRHTSHLTSQSQSNTSLLRSRSQLDRLSQETKRQERIEVASNIQVQLIEKQQNENENEKEKKESSDEIRPNPELYNKYVVNSYVMSKPLKSIVKKKVSLDHKRILDYQHLFKFFPSDENLINKII